LCEAAGCDEDHGVVTLSTFLRVELVAAATVALWVAVRFPSFGPKSLRSAVLFVGAACAALQLLALIVAPVARVPHGVYLALFGCIFPIFFGAFLTAAWMLRLFAASLGGAGGGGPGQPVHASSR
jgi:hypothetical protein